MTTSGFTPYADDNHAAWAVEVPEADDVRIPSSTSTTQPAFWAAPEGEDQPLLVVLHSWSTDYAQQLSIPLARWAVDNGWGMVAPNFRGVNNRPEATGSDLAVGDVIAAVEWALAEGGGDPDLVFGIGFSGGGMMALDLVGRHPEVFAGLVSWVPIYDLVEWDAHNRGQSPRPHYVWHLEASCGGQPREGSQAARSCAARSPATHLDAEDAEEVGVFLGAGLHDEIVPVSHAVRSFNALARPEDRFPPAHVAAFAEGRLPEDLDEPASAEHHFGDDADVLVARRSGRVTLVIFDGTHEMRYGPGIRWIGEGGWAPQDRG